MEDAASGSVGIDRAEAAAVKAASVDVGTGVRGDGGEGRVSKVLEAAAVNNQPAAPVEPRRYFGPGHEEGAAQGDSAKAEQGAAHEASGVLQRDEELQGGKTEGAELTNKVHAKPDELLEARAAAGERCAGL